MRYENPELMRQLGAEYVIGTLQGSARGRFERLMRTHAEAQHQVDFWEMRLSEFGQILKPVDPPAATRAGLLRRTEATPLAAPAPARRKFSQRRRRARWAWPYVAGFATAASLVLAFILGQRNLVVAPEFVPVTALASEQAQAREQLPIYVAQLQMPASSMRWLVSADSDHRTLTITAADDFLQAGRHSIQLWGVAPDAQPVALGVLPVDRDASSSFDIPVSLQGHQVTFVISLEPAGGSVRGKPSAAVMNEATALDQI